MQMAARPADEHDSMSDSHSGDSSMDSSQDSSSGSDYETDDSTELDNDLGHGTFSSDEEQQHMPAGVLSTYTINIELGPRSRL